jgi:hypothetical protein
MNKNNFHEDAELAHARNEGSESSRMELMLALACFFGAMLWSLFVGGWIRLGRRIAGKIRSRQRAERGSATRSNATRADSLSTSSCSNSCCGSSSRAPKRI